MTQQLAQDNEIVFYQNSFGSSNIEVLYSGENIWFSQKRIAGLYEVTVSAVNQHLRHMLVEDAVIKQFLITALGQKRYSHDQ